MGASKPFSSLSFHFGLKVCSPTTVEEITEYSKPLLELLDGQISLELLTFLHLVHGSPRIVHLLRILSHIVQRNGHQPLLMFQNGIPLLMMSCLFVKHYLNLMKESHRQQG